MTESLSLAGRLFALVAAGVAYLWLLGEALAPWLLPRAWRPFRVIAAPFLGWASLVAVTYPLNAALPARFILLAVGAAAGTAVLVRVFGHRMTWQGLSGERWWPPVAAGLLALLSTVPVYATAGTLSAVVADSDVEHFADVVGALLTFPIGWTAEAQMGLEATPIGLAYHYVHAAISAVTGVDPFGTAVPSHLAMVVLAPAGVYLFMREVLGATPRSASVAAVLSACGGLGLGISGFGWGQQTAALTTVPVGVAGIRRSLMAEDVRDVIAGSLLAALAAGSLYLATAPLLGGTALIYAGVLLPVIGVGKVLRRTTSLGVVVLAAGALSHLSTVGFFVLGGLGAADLTGRSTHVKAFASLPEALGVLPIELFRVGPGGPAFLGLLTTAGGGLLVLVGLFGRRGNWVLVSFGTAIVVFEIYLRLIRPFPYGEFKLLTSVWFLAPVLAASGLETLWSRRRKLAPVGLLSLALFAGGLLHTQWHVRIGLTTNWGAILPEREMDDLRAVIARVPKRAAVWVSGQLVPAVAVTWTGPETERRHGFTSREAGQSYLARRWSGAATALLALSGRPVYGLVRRHSTELRSPADPSDADFILLDASEDPLFLGRTEADLVAERGRLRLYRGAGADLPPATLPLGESLPGRRQGYSVRRERPPAAAGSGEAFVAHALWSDGENEAIIESPSARLRLTLFPGLTWLVSQESAVEIARADSEAVALVRSVPLRPGAWPLGEELQRSPAGVSAPAALITANPQQLHVRYVNVSSRLISVAARPHAGDQFWIDGRTVGPPISLDPPFSFAGVALSGRLAAWLEVGPDGRSSLHAPAGSGLFSLPLLGAPARLVSIPDGTLVKGASHRLHLMQGGRLRWVTTLEALQRRGPSPPLITLRDEELWRLPVGLPLD